jgi:predicted transcriptional regulator
MNDDRLDLFLPAELRAALAKIAEQNDRSVSAEARQAIRQYVRPGHVTEREEQAA